MMQLAVVGRLKLKVFKVVIYMSKNAQNKQLIIKLSFLMRFLFNINKYIIIHIKYI